ncbi:MAG: pyruvate kinase [Gammaproteobacteria bacterium]|nr:pyruvate kinase [Gammaproteobacteria bacterium]
MANKDLRKKIALHWRRTKIIATLGPASNSEAMVKKLIRTGVNIFRLNMSHGNHEQHRRALKTIRKVAEQEQRDIAILMDLCGPKIRVGEFENGEIELRRGESVTVSCQAVIGKKGLVPSQYKNLYKDVNKGERLLLDDGNLELVVEKVVGKEVICKVIYGGVLRNCKGLNLPDSSVSISSFTAKDKIDAALAVALGADFLALSFVRSEKDVKVLQRFLHKNNSSIPVIAKIEKPEAVQNIDLILKESYGIMVARGDLGIELPAEQVPLIQKDLVNKARSFQRPVIVATQMMESMITNSRPTRAEVGDVANAALSGADAVMLSAETASGKYPLQTVKTMDCVLREMEAYQWQHNRFGEVDAEVVREAMPSDRRAIARAVTALAQDLKLQGIVVPTSSGTTARILAADRPTAPLFGVCSDKIICRRLAMHWGVIPFHIEEKTTHNWKKLCQDISQRCQLTKTGRTVLLVSGFNDDPELNAPVMKLIRV